MKNLAYISSQKCTLFCKVMKKEDVRDALKISVLATSTVDSYVDSDGDFVVRVLDHGTVIEFYVLVRQAPGDKVSKTFLGAFNYFNKIVTKHQRNKEFVLKRLGNCNASVGVIGKPEMSDLHYELIRQVLISCDGMLFNGNGILNEDGELLLNSEGACSIEL